MRPKPDPPQLASGKCACGKDLPPYALKEGDPFCSTGCAHAYHGVAILQPGQGYTVGSSS